MVKVYIPRDTTALAMGAERLAAEMAVEAKNRGADIEIVRNSSRGMFWLEPLVEVETANGRVAYGPVEAKDIDSLFDADFVNGGLSHPLCQGLTEEIPYLKKQQRLTFARAGITDPVSLEDYQAHDGFKGLKKHWKCPVRPSLMKLKTPACVAVVVLPSLPASSGRLYTMRLHRVMLRRNTSFVTPTKVTPVPSLTVWSWKLTHSC